MGLRPDDETKNISQSGPDSKSQNLASGKANEKLDENLDFFKSSRKHNFLQGENKEEIVRLPYQLKREYVSILEDLSITQSDI